MNKKYLGIVNYIRNNKKDSEILTYLSNYHENDIADIILLLTTEERKKVYKLLGFQKTAEIFAYFDEPEKYLEEIPINNAAKIISFMDRMMQSKFLKNLTRRKRVRL